MSVIESMLDMLFPPRCPSCLRITEPKGTGGRGLFCETCAVSVEKCTEPLCTVCGLPLPGDGPGRKCGQCLEKPLPVERIVTPYLYGGAVASAVLRLKTSSTVWVGRMLGMRLFQSAPARDSYDLVVPVPLHPATQRLRGHNQAGVLARIVARESGHPLERGVLVRTMKTPDQRRLTKKQRFMAVRGAFAVPEGKTSIVKGARVLLMDDVVTTGATACECAAALIRAKAASVQVLALARTPPAWWS